MLINVRPERIVNGELSISRILSDRSDVIRISLEEIYIYVPYMNDRSLKVLRDLLLAAETDNKRGRG